MIWGEGEGECDPEGDLEGEGEEVEEADLHMVTLPVAQMVGVAERHRVAEPLGLGVEEAEVQMVREGEGEVEEVREVTGEFVVTPLVAWGVEEVVTAAGVVVGLNPVGVGVMDSVEVVVGPRRVAVPPPLMTPRVIHWRSHLRCHHHRPQLLLPWWSQ